MFQLNTEVDMVTSELNQSNFVTNRQCDLDFGQPILVEEITTRFTLNT